MKPLFVLLFTFFASVLLSRLYSRKANFKLSGNVAMCMMFVFTATGHFLYVDGMARMIPSIIPFKTQVVYFTGVMEIAMGLALLIQKWRMASSVFIFCFLIVVLPANIHSAINHVDFSDPAATGPGTAYLWFRIPLQVFFIVWVYFFSFRKFQKTAAL